MSESITIGHGDAAVTFFVDYLCMDAHRARWEYTITAADGTFLHIGTDLSGPEYGDAIGALQSLVIFAQAAVESNSSPYDHGDRDHGFPEPAVEAFDLIADDLDLACLEFDEGADLVLAD